MTVTLTKTKVALAVLAVAMLVPATALATHVFDDVPDDKFYATPVEWAAANNITTGKSPTTFAPDDNVTRGESVTFLKRYDDNIVQDVRDDIAANTADIAALITPIAVAYVEHNGGSPTVTGTSGVTATWDAGTGRYTVSVDGVTLSPATHAVNVTSIRINGGSPTEDRASQTFFSSGSVGVSVWDASASATVASAFHITIYELPS